MNKAISQKSIGWRQLLNDLQEGIAVLKTDGKISYMNRAVGDFFYPGANGLVPKNKSQQKIWSFFFRDFVKGCTASDLLELPMENPATGLCWKEIKLSRLENANLVFFQMMDVTEQKLYEEELKGARDDAEKATRTKSRFLANMSHEIRTPIHTIIGMSELMNLTKLDQEQDEYCSQIRFSADVLLSLVNDILDVSKIEAGQMNLEYAPFNLQEILEEAVEMTALEAHIKAVELGLFAKPGTDYHVMGDAVRLRQVAVNLINNAVKFTQKGQVIIRIERLKQNEESLILRISVRDSGIGIPQEKISNLFNAFTQADTSTTRRFGGTGLGLAISANLVSLMGGRLRAVSREGEGSIFYFTLKFQRAIQSSSKPSRIYGEELKGRRVLVVDDNPYIRKILSAYLKSWGCLVENASTSSEGLVKMKKRIEMGKLPYDLCIIDQGMSKKDGWQMGSEINAAPELSSTALILMPLKGTRGTEEAKMKLLGWFSAYLTKPVRQKALWEKCMQALYPEKMEAEELEELDGHERFQPNDDSGRQPRHKEGSLILVAEDHDVNRRLMEIILNKLGHQVLLAKDGKEAVELFESHCPDLIFMDCQMPVMNGYEATQNLRESGCKIPVIAVTANASKNEQIKCFHSGMNDFLPKPFKKEDLLPLLNNWLPPKTRPEESSEKAPEELEALDEPVNEKPPLAADPPQQDATLPQLPVFDFPQALETFLEDKELLLSLLPPYVEQVSRQLTELMEAETLENFQKVRSLAHSIKGSSRNLSMLQLGQVAETLEHAGRDEKKDLTSQSLPLLAQAFERLKSQLKNYIELP